MLFSQCARGLGCIIGPTMMGQLYDITGTYAIADCVAASSLSLGVVSMLGVMFLHNRQFQKSAYLK